MCIFLFIIGMFRRNTYEIQINTKECDYRNHSDHGEASVVILIRFRSIQRDGKKFIIDSWPGSTGRNPYEIQVNTKAASQTYTLRTIGVVIPMRFRSIQSWSDARSKSMTGSEVVIPMRFRSIQRILIIS